MSALATAIYRGRERVPALDPADRGLAYGDGLFETMRVSGAAVPWWDAHLARLAHGAQRLGIPKPDTAWLAEAAAALLADAPSEAVLKLVLTRGVGGRGYAAPETPQPTLLLSVHPLPAPFDGPLTLRWCDTRLALQPRLAGLKHLNRLEQVLARAEWNDAAIHEGLVLDAAGRVTCATAANVFAFIGGRWLTPALHEAGVAGIARGWVLANAPGAQEAELRPADIESAGALFLCNAVRGILPVGRLGSIDWAPHPALDELRRRLRRDVPAF
ncbi:MAG TPA: aminodeoxychorismate lyase [Arenimonas sp.]|nr:aminodeoxychorismate lyase [Arenimonas sp.]